MVDRKIGMVLVDDMLELAKQQKENHKNVVDSIIELMNDLAKFAGYDSPEDLFASRKKPEQSVNKDKRKKLQNPADHSQIYPGRGPRPDWLKDYLASGGKKEDIEVRESDVVVSETDKTGDA